MRRLRVCDAAVKAMPFIKVISLGLLVSACATSHASHERTSYDRPANVGASQERRLAVASPPKLELEDDGTAVQTPPRMRHRAVPDDPSEPFSPNYGPPPLPGETEAQPRHLSRQAIVQDQLRPRARPMSDAEVRAIIARAMVEHERRYP